MNSQILLYISAATDLEAERDILARAVVDIPVDLGWRIAQSPRHSEPLDAEAVVNADIHLLLMGGDIRAPVGLEWITAQRAGRRPILFLKQDIRRTIAALDFIRFVENHASWQPFQGGVDLRQSVQMLLVNYILEQALRFALKPLEMEGLHSWRSELEESPTANDDEAQGGTGESSLIFSKERYVPSKGILIRPDMEQNPSSSTE
jgi:hypothetical protein